MGYREREHTADWALDVWAPHLAGLFEQAARGMYVLMETQAKQAPRIERVLQLEATEAEDLLVQFLAELLFYMEQNGLVFDEFELKVDGRTLQAALRGAELVSQAKEIKAVTYHRLEIREADGRLECTLVFDV